MARLSSPIESIQGHYQVVVIGSGYGGGIAASRLARAGQQVCILERGREFQPGEYPNTEPEMLREAQADLPDRHIGSRTGLYDFHVNDHINVFVGCGLGGTSLVNANVSLPPESRVLEDARWPQELRDDASTLLKEGFRRAEEMLKPTPYPEDFPPLPKLKALEMSAEFLNQKFYRPPINVTFKDGVNHVGVEQQACKLCGDCVTGCNHSAKNTTLMNYLPDARNHGAEIFTQVSVRRLERKNGRWMVHYQLLDSGREKWDSPTMFLTADLVVLASGTLGSTEVLLRSKAAGLPVSDKVGHNFTGNGDVLAFSYNSDEIINGAGFGPHPLEQREPVGPCITGVIDLRNQPGLNDGMVIEEGSVPGATATFLPKTLAATAPAHGKDTDSDVADLVRERRQELESLMCGPYQGAIRNTQTYLVMTHDDGAGRMFLKDDRLRIDWPGVGVQPIFNQVENRLEQSTRPLGGIYLKNPLWSEHYNHSLTTVHPLGGCIMAADAGQGVVNHKGQVFSSNQGQAVYENLYVCDGSTIPRPLGVNPLLTISAVAERCCALIARDRNWQINYDFTPVAPVSAAPTRPGVRFTETMRGYFSAQVKDDFQKGYELGDKEHSSFEFTLTVISNDLEAMLADPDHKARMAGSATAPALSPRPLTVSDGHFNLFAADVDNVDTRQMRYKMKLTSEEGKTFFFEGFKTIKNNPGPDTWDDTTTLFITVHDGDSANSPVLGKGILKIRPDDFMRQMTTMEVTNAETPLQRLDGLLRFGFFFAGELFDVYGGVFARANEFSPDGPPRKKRPLRMRAPEVHLFHTSDGAQLRLTRYQGGTKGPVILSPGFGTSTVAFTVDTVDTNLPEYLYANGYDVWLFDYRASPELASSLTQFTLDDIATKDYPAAVAKVREVTGAESVQVMAHCIGSMTFLMAMLAGLEGVRSAFCSSLAFFPDSPTENRIKAGLDLGSFLTVLGVKTMTTDFDTKNWKDKLLDAVIKLNPDAQLCNSPVCRRILLIYGKVYKHEQLNDATHKVLHEMFGVANLTTFNHIALLVRKGKILDHKGKNVYLPQIKRLSIPIFFLHGAENGLFLPEGTLKTFKLLCEKNDPSLYTRIVIPNYAHMDLFVGKNAARDVFPEVLAALDQHNLEGREFTRRIHGGR